MLFKPDATVESDRAADAICTRALACFKDDRSARGAVSEGCTRKYLHIGACVVCTVGGVHGDGTAGRRAALATQQGDCAAVKAPVASRQRDSAASLFLIKRAARREAHIATIPAVPSTSRKDHNSTVREAGRAGTWWWKRRGGGILVLSLCTTTTSPTSPTAGRSERNCVRDDVRCDVLNESAPEPSDAVEEPVARLALPVTPAIPAALVATLMLPLDVVALVPPVNATLPPVAPPDADALPAVKDTAPPIPRTELPAPAVMFIAPPARPPATAELRPAVM
jgi:hypothetical protein